jgi:hypothetical protein
MKKLIAIAFIALLASCQSKDTAPIVAAKSTAGEPATPYIPVVKTGIEGFYTGFFVSPDNDGYSNKITLRIDSVTGNTVYGRSIVAGNERPFRGSIAKAGSQWRVSAAEPGDDKNDGVFTFLVDAKTANGTWKPVASMTHAPEKTYELARTVFRYDPRAPLNADLLGEPFEGSFNDTTEQGEVLTEKALKLNPSTRLLKPADVENLYKGDLEVLRNLVYARHGYSFRNLRMRRIFDNHIDWYMPVTTDVSRVLTPIELKNIELLKRYEAHASKYYDSFGR